MSNNMRRLHRTVFSGQTRVYPDGVAGSSAVNKIGIAMGMSTTGSGPYPASFMVHTFTPSNGAINSTSSTKRMVAANQWAYTMRMTSWPKSTRWIHAIRCDYGDDNVGRYDDDDGDDDVDDDDGDDDDDHDDDDLSLIHI